MDATDSATLFVLLSKTETTPPSATVVMASCVSLPGTTMSYTFTGLDRGSTYYGWAVATRQGYESAVMASTPASMTTDPYSFINNGFLTFTRASVATRVVTGNLPQINDSTMISVGTVVKVMLLLQYSQ